MSKGFIFGIGGGSSEPAKPEETKNVPLTMNTGNQVIFPSNGHVLTKVTVEKPATFISDNIKSGVIVAGVLGSYAGGDAGAMPTLKSVSISRSGTTLTISNPSSNGTFVSGYKIYNGAMLLTTTASTSFNLLELPAGIYNNIVVKAYGTNFNDSANSNSVSYNIWSITNSLTDLTNNNTAAIVGNSQSYTGTLSALNGKYIPDAITVTMGGSPAVYAYNYDTGVINIASVTGNLVITASAVIAKQLAEPKVTSVRFSGTAGTDVSLTIGNVAGAEQYCVEVRNSNNVLIDSANYSTSGTKKLTKGAYIVDVVYSIKVWATTINAAYISPSSTYSIEKTYKAGSGAVSFATDEWSIVQAEAKLISELRTSKDSPYKVGDTRSITLSTNEVITVAILGFNHDTLATVYDNGGTLSGISVGMVNCLANYSRMNNAPVNSGGWASSEMRTAMATYLSQLPSALQSVISPVIKKTSAGSTSSTINNSTDSLWLLSHKEVMGQYKQTTSGQLSFDGEGEQYSYFKNAKIPTGCGSAVSGTTGTYIGNNASYTDKFGTNRTAYNNYYLNYDNLKGAGNIPSSSTYWWLRSPYCNNDSYYKNFCCVSSDGGVNGYNASGGLGVSFGFCI